MCFRCYIQDKSIDKKKRYSKLRKIRNKQKKTRLLWKHHPIIFNIDGILRLLFSFLDDHLEDGLHMAYHQLVFLSPLSVNLFFKKYVYSEIFRSSMFQKFRQLIHEYGNSKRCIRFPVEYESCNVCTHHSFEFYVNYTPYDGHVYGFELDGKLIAYTY
jgi:hypothetical protein